MNPAIAALLLRIRALEEELDNELARRRAELKFTLHAKKVIFDQLVTRQHRQFRMGLLHYVLGSRPLILLTAPVIYSMVLPLLLLDLLFSLYQLICFPVYGIVKVRRSDYLIFDRNQLAYLNLVERLNCAYCSYGNGVIAYAREIAARTEQYWCPIKHARRMQGAHARYPEFVDYGDAEAYRSELAALRKALREIETR
jgi:hypothetical protein